MILLAVSGLTRVINKVELKLNYSSILEHRGPTPYYTSDLSPLILCDEGVVTALTAQSYGHRRPAVWSVTLTACIYM